MVSSDDEVEILTQSVTNYYFEDDQYEPVSFSVLPIKWSESDSSVLVKENVFLNGITDSGSERIYKKVLAWKLEFSYERPEVSVLSEDKSWIKLQKPRKSFEDTIRTTLITIHCLHFFKKHPGSSEISLWSHLKNDFSSYKVKPSETDLLDHLPLIKAAVKQDKTFAKIKFMITFSKDPKKRKEFDEDIHHDLVLKKIKSGTEDRKEFNEETVARNGNESDEVHNLCDDVCALCDNGGELLCCEGRCLRSFHATGFESGCKSLGLSKDQLKATRKFLCMNCQYNQHQCFACGKLGSSDRYDNAKVFRCVSATCGHFYHPGCVSKLLHPINEPAAEHIKRKIIAGEAFTCTVHKCFMCKREENKDVQELQFAICRRCPKVYHRKCLPREISFESILNEGILQRAWDRLLPNRILIYCLKHDIDVSTLAPKGNNIIFPDVQQKKKYPPDLQTSQGKMVTKRTSLDSRNHTQRDTVSQLKEVVKMPCAINHHNSTKIHAKQASRGGFGSSMKSQLTDASRSHLKDSVRGISLKVDRSSSLGETNVPLKDERLNRVWNKALELVKSKKQGVFCSKSKKTTNVPITKKLISSSLLRSETEMRKVDLMKKKPSSKSTEIVTKSHKEVSTHAYSSDNVVDKAILQGHTDIKAVEASVQKLEDSSFDDPKASYELEVFNHAYSDNVVEKAIPQGNVEGSVKSSQAVEASVQTLEDYSFGDPKANYEPEIFNQVYSSENVVEKAIPQGNVEGFVKSFQAVEVSVQKLRDYSFDEPKANYKSKIFNQAYSSDNEVEKAIPQGNVEGSVKAVEASVQKLEDYSFDGPKTNYEPEIFNHLTKSKIADKLLCYAVYGDTILNVCCHDNDFSCLMRQKLEEIGKKCSVKNYEVFQSKGGFDFKREDWITSSRLIIGLIFPYGVEGVPVNMFIDKVLEFKPKLLVLVCPRDTTISFGEKESPYDLIWEDAAIFSCKMDSESPMLYLWSRFDWTKTSKKIALEQGHISNEQKDPITEDVTTCTNHEEAGEFMYEEAMDAFVNTVGTFRPETGFNENLFAPGLLQSCPNRSCGWLDE